LPERRDATQEVVRQMGTRRPVILLGVSMALLFLASALVSTEPSAQTTSPEGKIVFVKPGTEPSDHCFGNPCADIRVMDADGTDQTNLTPTAAGADNFHEYQPSWAPSGAQLTFVRELEGEIISEQSDIFVMDTDPTTDDAINLTQTDESEIDPAWSPDGTKLAFAGVRNSGFEIVTMDPDGQNETILSGDSFDGEDRAPDWSRTARRSCS
jgi:Tol biopolymer transport system component